jgi:hypothetical protein
MGAAVRPVAGASMDGGAVAIVVGAACAGAVSCTTSCRCWVSSGLGSSTFCGFGRTTSGSGAGEGSTCGVSASSFSATCRTAVGTVTESCMSGPCATSGRSMAEVMTTGASSTVIVPADSSSAGTGQ